MIAILSYQSKLATNRVLSLIIILLSNTTPVHFLITLLLIFEIIKPNFKANKEKCFTYEIKLLFQKKRLSKDIASNK